MTWAKTLRDVHHLEGGPEGFAYSAAGYGEPGSDAYLVVAYRNDLRSDRPFTGRDENHWRGPEALANAKTWLEELAREDERDAE